jgi:RNA polymerase sigma-70 factor, ECF subfamily
MSATAVRAAHVALEGELRALVERGATNEAATLALRRAGPELVRFLVHAHGSETTGADVFSLLAEDIWRGLPSFRWECSFRTWTYALARRASARYRRSERAHGGAIPLSELGALSELIDEVRTRTLSRIREENRSAIDALKGELDVDERMLLSLRVERELSWAEIAAVLADEGHEAGAADAAAQARLRKRFQLLKERLKRRGRELGLVSGRDG